MKPVLDLLGLLETRAAKPGALRSVADGDALMAHLFRQFEEERRDGPQAPRISRLGACARQLAYYVRGEPRNGKETDLRALLTWGTGDAIEIMVAAALADALMGTGYTLLAWAPGTQARFTLRVAGRTIIGHPDGILVEDAPPHRWAALLSIKSRSSYGFADDERRAAESGGEPWGPDEAYWWQTQGYLWSDEARSAGVEQEIVVTVCKDSGAAAQYAFGRAEEALPDLAAHLAATEAEDPPRALPGGQVLGPSPDVCARCGGAGEVQYVRGLSTCKTCDGSGRGKPAEVGILPWQCAYCPFWGTCWPSAIAEVGSHNGRPRLTLRLRDGR